MIILGVDPGTAEMGWGIIKSKKSKGKNKGAVKYVDHGMIRTSSEDPLPERLLLIKEGIGRLLGDRKIDEVVIERLVFNVNKKSAISVAQAYGVVMLAAAELGIPVYEYNALEAKYRLTGNGRADKKIVQQEVKKRLHLKQCPTPNHAADALAIALCHVFKNNVV